MTRGRIEEYLYLMDEAFEGHGEHSLLANLRSLSDGDWCWLPPSGDRTILDIVQHVGECKYVYNSHAFGDGSMRWDLPGSLPSIATDAAPEAVIAWLREGQRWLRASVASLGDDAELLRPRRANWGQEYETRWLINVMIQHDLYHGGEVNHIRALRQENDRWAWAEDPT